MAADGTVITGDEEIPDGNMELLYADSGNSLGWRLEYWMDKKSFENAILEEQNYVIVQLSGDSEKGRDRPAGENF